jgi:hypothetical protein
MTHQGSESTIGKLEMILREHMRPTEFVRIAKAYGLDFVTDPNVHRWLKAGRLDYATDKALRRLVLSLANYIQHAQPLPLSFSDPELTLLLVDLKAQGLLPEVAVGSKDGE